MHLQLKFFPLSGAFLALDLKPKVKFCMQRSVRGFIVVASLWLGLGPAYLASVMWKEIPISWEALVLVLLLLMSPAWAGPVRCTTYEEKTTGRLQTLCDDGTRATSTWSPTLGRWDTTVTPPPGQRCTGRLNPNTRPWEGRCQ